MPELKISPELSLPLETVTESLAILAVKRAGKSNAAVVIAEEMYDAGLPWVAIDPKGDWWGVRAAGDDGQAPGLEVVVFGGLHGDVPLEPTAGRLIADLIAETRLTSVLDVSEMTKADQRRFLTDFADRLYRRNTEPLHVFCEEADEYIPQRVMGEQAKLVGAFETLVKRGGFRGIGITLVTQRSASLNKDVLTQVGTLVVLRTPSPQDRKAIEAWIDYHATSKEIVAELPGLDNGEAWISSPTFLRTLVKVRFRRRRTFDSGATPTVGGKPRPPARLADVDLAAIKEQMADTIERAKADDPKELRKRIAQLERDLAAAKAAAPEPVVERVEVSVLDDTDREIVLNGLAEVVDAIQELDPKLSDLRARLDRITLPAGAKEGSPRDRVAPGPSRQQQERVVRTAGTPNTGDGPRRQQASPATSADAGPSDLKLGRTERRILTVLATYGPRTLRQLALQSGYSAKASTIGVAASKLRKAGYIEQGTPFTATPAGLDWLGDYEPLPTGPALLEHWKRQFGKTESLILDALLEAYPSELRTPEIAERTGYSPVASTIGVALSKLRKVEIVEGFRVSDQFMEAIR